MNLILISVKWFLHRGQQQILNGAKLNFSIGNGMPLTTLYLKENSCRTLMQRPCQFATHSTRSKPFGFLCSTMSLIKVSQTLVFFFSFFAFFGFLFVTELSTIVVVFYYGTTILFFLAFKRN